MYRFFSFFLALIAPLAATAAELRVPLDMGGDLAITHPDSWKSSVRPGHAGSTVSIAGPNAQELQLLITPIEPANASVQAPTPAEIKSMVVKAAASVKTQAVESELPVVELGAPRMSGYYFSATDRDPGPSGFKFLTQGAIGYGDLRITFTILMNGHPDALRGQALDVLRSIRRQEGSRAPAQVKPTTLVIPGQSWAVSFEAPLLSKQKEGNQRSQYMYLGNAGRFNLSLYVEDPDCAGGLKHEDYYKCFWPKASRNPLIDKESVVHSCKEKYCKVEYDVVATLSGQKVRQKNINFLFAYRGKWTDLHVSIVRPTQDDLRMLQEFENSLSYGDVSQ